MSDARCGTHATRSRRATLEPPSEGPAKAPLRILQHAAPDARPAPDPIQLLSDPESPQLVDVPPQESQESLPQQSLLSDDAPPLLVERPEDVAHVEVRDPERLAYVTQTTLSVDDTIDIVAALRARFPAIVGPHKEDICYATTNRQAAVKALAPRAEAMLVVGAPNSSNSRRLVEVGANAGCNYAQLVQRATDIDWRALDGIASIGITAGASAPEELVNEVIDAFRSRYDVTVEHVETATENVEFKVPRVLRQPA